MSFVLDASVTLAWTLPDERDERALHLLDRCLAGFAAVPAHWPAEVLNGLLVAERKARIGRETTEELLSSFSALPITIYPAGADGGELVDMARQHKLTIYDAAYLQLATKLEVGLATFDGALARAATTLGLTLL